MNVKNMGKYQNLSKIILINSIPILFVILWASGSVFVKMGRKTIYFSRFRIFRIDNYNYGLSKN